MQNRAEDSGDIKTSEYKQSVYCQGHSPLVLLLRIVRATLPSALNVMNASAVGKLVQLVTASRLTYITKDKSIQ